MKKLDNAAIALIMIGAFQLGIIGIFNINILNILFEREWADRFIYAIIGFAAVYKLVYWRNKDRWKD